LDKRHFFRKTEANSQFSAMAESCEVGWRDETALIGIVCSNIPICRRCMNRFVFCFAPGKKKPGGVPMHPREAIRILMLSPVYFRLSVSQRWQLVREYCRNFNAGRAMK